MSCKDKSLTMYGGKIISVNEWIQKIIPALNSGKRYEDAHIELFLSQIELKKLKGIDLVNKSLELFLKLISVMKEYDLLNKYTPSVYFGLKGAPSRIIKFDKSNDYLKQIDTKHPPNLILISKREPIPRFSEYYSMEGITLDIFNGLDFHYNIIYTCGRDHASVENNWEYVRGITIEYLYDTAGSHEDRHITYDKSTKTEQRLPL